MRDLEELLRQLSREPRPKASPPAGGFEAVRQRLTATPTAAPGYWGWAKIFLLLLAGLGGLAGLLERSDTPPPPLLSFPVAPPPPVAPKVVATTTATVGGTTVDAVARKPTEVASVSVIPATSMDVPTTAVPIARAVVTEREPQPSLPKVVTPLDATPARPVAATRYVVAQLPVPLPTPEPRQRLRATGSWELRFNGYPNRHQKTHYVTTYTDRPPSPGFPPMGFVQDGDLRLFYYDEPHALERRGSSPILQLQLNRRTRIGLHYGIGMIYFQDNYRGRRSARSLVTGGSGVYATYNDGSYNLLLASAQLGFTLPLGRRWETWIGAGAQVGLRREEETTFQLIGADGAWRQTDSRTVDYPLGNGGKMPLIASLEVGLRYRVVANWRLGLSVGAAPTEYADVRPTLGLDAVYDW